MPPGWVATSDDYARWLEKVVATSGGYVTGGVRFTLWPIHEDDPNSPVLLEVVSQRLYFQDDSFLDFSMVIDTDLTCLQYSFHYQAGSRFWRKDFHEGHEKEDGRPEHLHCSIHGRSPHKEVDLSEAIAEVTTELWLDPTYHACNDS